MKKIGIFIIVILFSSLYISLVGQSKKSSDELKKEKQKTANEIKQKQKLLDETRKNKKAQQQQLGILRDQIATRETYMAALQSEINGLSAQRVENENEAARLNRKLNYMKEDYSRVVYNAYKSRNINNPMLFLLSAEDYSQMFRRMRFYTTFSQNVKKQVEEIKAAQLSLNTKLQEITLVENDKQNVMAEQEAANAEQHRQKREAEQLSSSLKKKESSLVAEIRKKQKERDRIEAEIKKAIQREIEAQNKAKANANKGKSGSGKSGSSGSGSKSSTPAITMTPAEQQLNATFVNNKGKLPWPVASCAKIQDFGTYPAPDAPSVMYNSNSIVLLTQANADVKAVFNGTVSHVGSVCGVMVVMVRHGEYLTVYQNIKNVTVKQGQSVTTGQKIGTVALTDSGTPELSFSVLKGTAYQNPNSWLKK